MGALGTAQIASLLRELASRSALAGGNPYRARAYSRAADSLSVLAVPLGDVIQSGQLRQIPGVGSAIADIITKLHQTGTHPMLEKLRQDLPPGVLDLLSVPALPSEKVAKLHHDLGISSLSELKSAVDSGQLAKAKGFGPAFERKVKQGLAIRASSLGARHLHRAEALLDSAKRDIAQSCLGAVRIEEAGDFRRKTEVVRDLALVVTVSTLPEGERVRTNGDLTIWLADAKHHAAALLNATGSAEHLRQLTEVARDSGYELTRAGLLRDAKTVLTRTEADIYRKLGLQFILPELREGRGEVELAKAKQIPQLVEDRDLRGILHAHTNRSDGVNTLEEMAEATRARGYDYFGVCDHSQSAHYAGGLSVAEIEQQHKEVERLNDTYGGRFRIFKGIESDILPDGSLDYSFDILGRFDFVVASVHGQFRLDRERQTDRLIKAIANPYTTILGHMTGRQLLRRPGYELDVDRVLAACAEHGVAVEINANPWRLDLDWRYHRRALELGCRFSINPDAHSTEEIGLTRWGVSMARKGGIPSSSVINALNASHIAQHFQRRRAKANLSVQ